MLRDYQRKQSLNKWCFKSVYFVNKHFHTPLPLELHLDFDGYVFIASKFLYLTATQAISMEEVVSLRRSLHLLKYWKDLGFEEAPTSEQVISKIEENRATKKCKKLSESKCMF
ncbi:uncharacterized protein BX663DRAFT_501981 [Cokeromyces recurvatus]|uniref:uncharacterized protein n=1 Tax=Cokeromyces recurvatus TaxID=90255 RepID=UPI00221FE123|nr:uncharacterized protein BX663DRAFT_501981 [Cokeromyces recurvatus]KAI7905180.1 hypothetical protein BX663DRAFT_501981 [Cokeromyces recurvatus]